MEKSEKLMEEMVEHLKNIYDRIVGIGLLLSELNREVKLIREIEEKK